MRGSGIAEVKVELMQFPEVDYLKVTIFFCHMVHVCIHKELQELLPTLFFKDQNQT